MSSRIIKPIFATAVAIAIEESQTTHCNVFLGVDVESRDHLSDSEQFAVYGQSVKTGYGDVRMLEHPRGFAEFLCRDLEDTTEEKQDVMAVEIRKALSTAVADARTRMLPGQPVVVRYVGPPYINMIDVTWIMVGPIPFRMCLGMAHYPQEKVLLCFDAMFGLVTWAGTPSAFSLN